MGKWIAKLAAIEKGQKTPHPPAHPPSKPSKHPFEGFEGAPPGGAGNFEPPPAAPARLAAADAERLAEDFEERAAIAEFDAGRPRAEAEAAAQASIEARLLRWRWPAEEARATAERIARRAADDDRVTCTECRNFRPAPKAASGGQCAQHRRAGLLTPPVCRELAALAQRCHAFEPADGRGPQA